MDKTKTTQAEKLQSKLDKLLLDKEKKQATFEKSKQDLSAISKKVDSVKLQLFEILQSGSDDTAFSNWAKRKISENGSNANTNTTNQPKQAKPENPTTQNQQAPTGQKHQPPSQQNNQPPKPQN